MKKLIQGIVDFRRGLTEESRALFAQLALGQKPDALFIACSDSRVVPNLFASTNPGDLFVLRNVGNLVPHFSFSDKETSAAAALEYSLFSLKILDIVVCGHSDCGAIQTLIDGVGSSCFCELKKWLEHGREALDKVRSGMTLNPLLSESNQISQVNVLQQMEHIASYPYVQERLQKGTLRIHGWWFDIAHADVYCYEPTLNRFVMIDEKEAKIIIDRLS